MSRGLLAGYFLAGYPNISSSIALIKKSVPGVDIFEIGYPSRDPFFEGDVIRQAHKKVLEKEAPDIIYWKKLRAAIDKPLWIMAYKNDFIRNGLYRTFAAEKLMDSLVLPDCSDEERLDLQKELAALNVEVIGFVNGKTPPEQLDKIASNHKTIYFQLYLGKTGSTGKKEQRLSAHINAIKAHPGVRLLAGFGIDSAEKSCSLIDQGFDGVIIGTALLKALRESEGNMLRLIRDISCALTRQQ
ncbi:MAG: tryptophan synthase subunit alpha [Treponema sp.]|jgi:tryptophan synthase alpha chain|nr:tryptophan synthase subunit alpha [Treponema sp.]